MLRRFVSPWLGSLLLLSLLTACGGGSDEPSGMFSDTARAEETTTETTTDESNSIAVELEGQQIIPSGGTTTIVMKTFKADTDGTSTGEVEPHVTLQVSLFPERTPARLENAPISTDNKGDATFRVSHPGSGNVTVHVSGIGRIERGFDIPLYFGGNATADFGGNGVAIADGETPIAVKVVARDFAGVGIAEIPVDFAFPAHSSATPIFSEIAVTGSDGALTVGVTNIIPEIVEVTPFVGGFRVSPLLLGFGTSSVITAVNSLDLVIKNDNALANGQATNTLVIMARDETQAPVPHVPVNISTDSATAILQIGDQQNTLFINGNTGEAGYFEVNITNTVEEQVNLSAITSSGDQAEVRNDKTLQFTTSDGVSGVPVASISLEVVDNNQPANGSDQAFLRGRVLDEANQPIAEQAVSIIVSGGSASIDMVNGGTTDASGRFFASLTDAVVEEFRAYAAVGEVRSNEVKVRFVAIPIEPEPGQPDEVLPTPPDFITLLASPISQLANGTDQISLIATVRNSQNVPMQGVKVSIAADRNAQAAIFDVGQQETDAGGKATFKVSSTQAGQMTVTARAWVEDSNGNIVGNTISGSRSIRFITESTEAVEVAELIVSVINNNQLATGEDAINVNVIARDNGQRPVNEAPIFVQLSAGSAAVVAPSRGQTDANGLLPVSITSTEVGEIEITFAVEDSFISKTVTVNFTAQSGADPDVKPAKVDLEVLNNNQPADGESKITLIARPKDANNAPLTGVDIQFIDESDHLDIPAGVTNILGEYRVSITGSVAETFKVTPVVVKNETSVPGNPVFLTFTSISQGNLDFQVIDNEQPANGQSAITLVVTFRDTSGNPISDRKVTFLSDSNIAQIKEKEGQTNAIGEFRTTVTSTFPETFNIIPVVESEGKSIVGLEKSITFIPIGATVTDLNVIVVKNNQSADGVETAQIDVIARDSNNLPVAGVPILVRLPAGSTAVAQHQSNVTNEQGVFSTNITSTLPGEVTVTIGVEEATIPERSVVVNFVTATAITPKTVDLQLENAPQPANGEAMITLIATPRDETGSAIPGVDIELISDSNTAVITPTSGTTNSLGEFRATVVNTVAETFNVTPVAGGVKGNVVPVTFVPVGIEVTDLRVNIVNNNQLADGQSRVTLEVIAKDSGGRAVANVPIVAQIATGEPAIATFPQGNLTDERGVLTIEMTSNVAGEVPVTIAIEGTNIASVPQLINFIAESGITPTSVELIVENAPQPADGQSKITLIVIPRDERNTPVAGVDIQLIKDSDEITIAQESGISDILGAFRTTVVTTNDLTDILTETLVVNVTPVAAGRIRGEATPVVFTPVAIPIPATLTLTVTNNNQQVGQEITLTTLARDENNSPMKDVRIKLFVSPGDEPPDITGSALFGASGFEGKTDANSGTFQTTVTNNQPGTFKVTASVVGRNGEPILNSNPVDVIFVAAPDDTVKEVTSIRLISDSPQLDSEGKSEGVLITAFVKNKANNPVEGALVSFRADSGLIQPIQMDGSSVQPGLTDSTGRAQARLTTGGNPDNRTITVTATVPTTTGEIREDTIPIEVAGTIITVSGQDTTILGTTIDISIFIKDSAGKGIGGQTLTVTSSLGNIIDNPSPVTNASGQANIKLTANIAGQETITVSKEEIVSGELIINISEDNFTLDTFPNPSVIEISLNTSQEFVLHWDKNGIPQAFESINISSTRGLLSTTNVLTDLNGDARFTITANNSGPAVITATAAVSGGPSKQISVDFIAGDANSMTLQADPITIGVNTPDSDAQQSEIIAVVRDPENNLVKGKRINFTLEDVTGGRLFPSSAITDSFGRASTVYFAGISPSASNGVKVTATVVDTPTVTASVNLTVAAKSLFVTLGTGNQVEVDGPTRYKQPYTVLVNDVNGVAVPNAQVVLSVLPLTYGKGIWFLPPKTDEEEEQQQWTQVVTSTCDNEDRLSSNLQHQFNGLLDAGEDLNNSGKLEPGNVATFDSGGVLLTAETDNNGFADFNIVYPKENAMWVTVRVTATVTVAGSEGSDRNEFVLPGAASDYINPSNNPPGNPSPFGAGVVIDTTEDVNGNGRLDRAEDGIILENGILDTEDLNGNGILDPGEDGTIFSHFAPDGATQVFNNPREGELDTEDVNGNGQLDESEDINGNGILDVTYVSTCNNTL